jgi:hypothetical protein
MPMGIERTLISALGALQGHPTVQHSASLGTSTTQVTLTNLQNGEARKVKIVNCHATNKIAWVTVSKGASAPTITATPGTGSCGVIILPLTSEYVTLNGRVDLYVVADAASTSFIVAELAV